MDQSVDNNVASDKEWLIGLYEHLKGLDLNAIKENLNKVLNDPDISKGINEAGEKLDHLKETLPNVMKDQIHGMASLVAQEIQKQCPELADDVRKSIEEYKLSDEDIEKLRKNISDAKKDFTQWYDKNLRDMVDSAVGDLKKTIKDQFNSAAKEEGKDLAYKTAQAPRELAESLAQMYKNEVMRPSVKQMLGVMREQQGDEYVKSVVEQMNAINGNDPIDVSEILKDTQGVEVAAPMPTGGVMAP